ncbi:hypothetical protein E1B28_003805 [Marasmius oreades]|uniref:Uncharacterized protein n=1 Tax=Marasmius oreades TaxID=181124 RepID=A0A9P7UXB7_9AGAR|nr:uncharacterized protein E1B28_003805 [Marasmius oreades]KAG7096361.1 hypothetical protein E1B28_003805 [Marasmius oreades]
MKFLTVLTALVFATVATAEPIDKRACGPTNCVCNGIQGQFCGNESVNPACRNDHVYECARGSGRACDYGYRNSCARCGELQC